jgi:hypothetical protein
MRVCFMKGPPVLQQEAPRNSRSLRMLSNKEDNKALKYIKTKCAAEMSFLIQDFVNINIMRVIFLTIYIYNYAQEEKLLV